jgi:hypothetical protein
MPLRRLFPQRPLSFSRPKQQSDDSSKKATAVDIASLAAAEQRLQQGNNGVIHDDNSQCQFNPRTFKILYVIKSENCFYRRLCLRRAKEVSESGKIQTQTKQELNSSETSCDKIER